MLVYNVLFYAGTAFGRRFRVFGSGFKVYYDEDGDELMMMMTMMMTATMMTIMMMMPIMMMTMMMTMMKMTSTKTTSS